MAELIFTFGVAVVIEEVVQFVWGRPAKSYEVDRLLSGPGVGIVSPTAYGVLATCS